LFGRWDDAAFVACSSIGRKKAGRIRKALFCDRDGGRGRIAWLQHLMQTFLSSEASRNINWSLSSPISLEI